MQTVLTIAGFDPSSGAGVTADLMVFAAHGLFGTSCITALTVQSTLGVRATYPVEDHVVKETLECLNADLPSAGIKIGMLATERNTFEVSRFCADSKAIDSELRTVPIVLDPVLRSTSGRELMDPGGLATLRDYLLPAVDWITPNLQELAALTNHPDPCRADIATLSRRLQREIPSISGNSRLGIIVTGGDLDAPDDYMLTPDGAEFRFPGVRIESTSTHGTGCAFSSAFLSRLVLGDTPYDACTAAKRYVSQAIQNAPNIGQGTGPINHLWDISKVKH